ncbi:hypothetical protein EC501_11350 [Lysinibacillus halotolerans]|uniref:Uncharacterized protein n=1 Tax=Lysinibacillus halotolerans TaxID=1368476 RepID=A0A3M8H7L4_9BACI|nr:hypothetical protein EC501_11350 [Lysinibacillus halotolerans]
MEHNDEKLNEVFGKGVSYTIYETFFIVFWYTLKGIFIRKNKEYFCGKYYTNSEFIILPYLLNKKFTFGCLTQY